MATPLRSLLCAILVFAAAHASAADAGAAAASIRCALRTERPDQHEYVCSVPAGATARRYRVVARFSGSHDDTMASIAATLRGGAPVTCDAGSNPRTMGEDGDVAVDCRFALLDAASSSEIAVVVRWTHAQFVEFEAVAD